MRDAGGDDYSQLIAPLILIVVFIAGYALKLRLEARRVVRMKHLTGDENMAWYGDNLPPELPPQLLESLPASLAVINCFSGLRNGERVVAFDYLVGAGKQTRVSQPSLCSEHIQNVLLEDFVARSSRYSRTGCSYILRALGFSDAVPCRVSLKRGTIYDPRQTKRRESATRRFAAPTTCLFIPDTKSLKTRSHACC
jgi:hypothetical protein